MICELPIPSAMLWVGSSHHYGNISLPVLSLLLKHSKEEIYKYVKILSSRNLYKHFNTNNKN
jgi:hypothetical protein